MAMTSSQPVFFRRLEFYFTLAFLCYVFAQAIYPNLEKRYYWGELFTFCSIFFLLRLPCHEEGYGKHLVFLVLIWMFFFPVYGIIISKLFWNDVFDKIFLVRHAVFFYYSAFFFLAYKYSPLLVRHLDRFTYPLLFTVPVISLYWGNFGIHALYGFLLMAVSRHFPHNKRLYHCLLFYIFFALVLNRDGGTAKFLLLVFLCFFALNFVAPLWKKYVPPLARRLLIYTLGIFMIFLFFYALSKFYDLTTQMAMVGAGITAFDETSRSLHTDLNGLWRPALWSHLYGRFLQHPWGLGLGTPLFETWLDGFMFLHLYRPGENYVQGAHNSFITFFARLGIPCVVLFSLLFFYSVKLALQVFSSLHFRPLQTSEGRLLTGCFLSIMFITVSASFNVVLESPLSAGIFWFSFGLFARLFGDAAANNGKIDLTAPADCT